MMWLFFGPHGLAVGKQIFEKFWDLEAGELRAHKKVLEEKKLKRQKKWCWDFTVACYVNDLDGQLTQFPIFWFEALESCDFLTVNNFKNQTKFLDQHFKLSLHLGGHEICVPESLGKNREHDTQEKILGVLQGLLGEAWLVQFFVWIIDQWKSYQNSLAVV